MAGTARFTELQNRLRQHVEALAAGPRPPGTAAHERAAEYVREQLTSAGWGVKEGPFSEDGMTGLNLFAGPWPNDPERPLFIVGAHYDSVTTSPGADDNASGVAGLLELARLLGPSGTKVSTPPGGCRLLLAAYDREEWGLVGSFVHSRELHRAGTAVAGMISLEMLGYVDHRPGSQQLPPHLVGLYPDVANFIGVCANDASQPLLQHVVAGLKSVAGLPVEFISVPGTGEAVYQTRLSDHSSFWDRGYPALMITDTSFFHNPHYHQATDTPDTLNYGFLAQVVAGTVEAVQRCLGGLGTAAAR